MMLFSSLRHPVTSSAKVSEEAGKEGGMRMCFSILYEAGLDAM